MTNMCFPTIEDYNDPDAKNTYRQQLLAGATPQQALQQAQMISRDNARTPMQWIRPPMPFYRGKPWLGINPNYLQSMWKARNRTPILSTTAIKN